MMKFAIVSTFLLAAVFAEPPAPRSSYLPPQARSFAAPSSQYGAPSLGRTNYAAPAPRTNYGAPAQQQPRSQYGPPQQQQQPRSQYGAPAQQQPSSNYGPPSTSYGVPSAQDFNNFDSQRANSYQQAPSNQYGVPAQGSFAAKSSYSQSDNGDSYGQSNGNNNGYSNGGYSNGGYEEPAKYEFQYDVQDEQAGLDFGHKEQRDGSVATGKYYVLLPDGRKQIVNYIADENGYRPTITYEDTGRGSYNNNAQGYDSNAQGFGGY